jgi:ATP phosphoribosyltransferase regulatory subunit HisZ
MVQPSVPADPAILRALCSHIVTSNSLAKRVSEALEQDDWATVDQLTRVQERESKAVADLSGRLRLTPKSKWGQERAATLEALNSSERRPWEIEKH